MAEVEKLPAALTYADMKAPAQAALESATAQYFAGKSYDRNKMAGWIDEANSHLCSALTNVSKNYKYCLSTVVMQKSGAGLETSSAAFWDTSTDGVLSVQWASSHLVVLVTAFVTTL